MFGYTDARLIFCSLLFTFSLLFCGGCHRQRTTADSAVDFYVDAVMLKELDKQQEAVEKLNSAVKANQNFSLAYSLLGEIYQELEDYEKSAASYERATQLNPFSFSDFFNLGRVYQIMEKFTRAVKAYVRACELKPDHLQAHINTAKSYYELKQYDDALIYGRRAEQINPDVGELQEILGDVYESQRDHEQAISSYKRALEIDSNNPRIMTSLAVAYLRTGRIEPAKVLLTTVTEVEPQNGKAFKYLGYCHLKFHNRTVESYKDDVRTDAQVLSIKEEALSELEEAIKNFNKAIDIDAEDWYAHKGLGVAYILKGKSEDGTVESEFRDKAVHHWRLSLQIYPDQPRSDGLRKLIRKYKEQ